MDSYLVQALKDNSETIISEWIELVRSSSDRYKLTPESELKEHVETHFEALLEIYEHNRYDKLMEFLARLADVRHSSGFSVKETHNAFLNGQSVIMKHVDCARGGKSDFCHNCREVRDSFNSTQSLYSQVFQDFKLEKAERSFEQKIHEKDLRLSSLTENTSDAIIILDDNFIINSWNRGAEMMYQYTREEIVGSSLNKIIPEYLINKGELETLGRTVQRKGSIRNYVTERVRKDGKILSVNISGTWLKNDEGETIGIISVHRDISERLRLEQEIRSQEQLLSSIVDHSVDAIIGLDLDDNIISWNHGAQQLFGYTRTEVIGKKFDILLPEESVKSGELRTLNESLLQFGSVQNYESERITKSGKRIITSLTRSLIVDKKGNVIGSSAILRDITEYKRLKAQMSHSEKLSVVGQLAAGIAHEVGNPLTSISSLIQVLSRTSNDMELQERLTLIKKQTDRITRLIRDLVNISQPSDFEVKKTDINHIVKEAVNIIKYDKRAKHCSFNLQLSKKLPLLEMPEDQFLQVIINIVLNAVDAVPKEKGEILILTERRDGHVQVNIRDNGPGIAAGILDKIFDPFFTTKDVGKGTGLGLWVSYGIIESLNGEITVKSNKNDGTEFTVRVPA